MTSPNKKSKFSKMFVTIFLVVILVIIAFVYTQYNTSEIAPGSQDSIDKKNDLGQLIAIGNHSVPIPTPNIKVNHAVNFGYIPTLNGNYNLIGL